MTTQELIQNTEKAASQITSNPLCDDFYTMCINRKVEALKANPSTKSCLQVLEDIKLIAEQMVA